MSEITLPVGWRANTTEDVVRPTGDQWTYYTRTIGPWRLEAFPPAFDGDPWTAQCEMGDGEEIQVCAATLGAAVAQLESALLLTLGIMQMSLVSQHLSDDAWETAARLGEAY